jgi:hypothetical protein
MMRTYYLILSSLLLILAAIPNSQLRAAQAHVGSTAEGRALADELLGARPPKETQIYGTLKVRNGDGKSVETPIRYSIQLGTNGWSDIYETQPVGDRPAQRLVIRHVDGEPNEYTVASTQTNQPKTHQSYSIPFSGSDFWITDLGLEFLHWPEQRLLKKEMRRGRACQVLESVNPTPENGGYSRVVSWVDTESGGLVRAEAYDAHNKLLKQFSPRHFTNVKGHWEIREIEIRNDQTDSRTFLEFNYETR